MAYRDYIHCQECGCKLIYDGNDSIRDSIESQYDNAPIILLCPDCAKKYKLVELITSEQVIAEAEKHFAELTEPVDGVPCKQWLDWRSFYTGYTDGRIKGFE